MTIKNKRLEELTTEELLNMDMYSQSFQDLVDLECAHKGVCLLPPNPGEKPNVTKYKSDMLIFEIGGWGFKNREHAEAILAYIEDAGPCKRKAKNGEYVVVPMTPDHYNWPEITTKKCFSSEKFAQIKDSAKISADLIKEWSDLKNKYDNAVTERKGILEEIKNKIYIAKDIQDGIDSIIANFRRYITLAQGQYKIALSFLIDAYKDGSLLVKEDDIYYVSSANVYHLALSQESYRTGEMNSLLGVTDDEKTS
ncbi:MAG: hypothetical protein DRH26_00570 [Deltaproteobacteria bacterium]|nr:MAG: hypothetical protein DRH26_00570 [Deltaproteobacteria bacterium]